MTGFDGKKSIAHDVFMRHTVFCLLLSFSSLSQADPALIELQQAALHGDAWAQLNLAAAYDNGLAGAAKNPALAVKWYRRSAEQGLVKAQFNLAHCLATGYGTDQDLFESRRWMALAAEQGMADAQYLLGVMSAEGLGGVVDLAAARRWLSRASENGNQDACERLESLN